MSTPEGMTDTAPIAELLATTGFENARELRDLLTLIPLDTHEQRNRFEIWLERDGTKRGLLHALVAWPRSR